MTDALLADATRVPEWGYGAKYRGEGARGEQWLARALTTAHAARDADIAAWRRRMGPQQERGAGPEIGG